jgi:FkbM family methyltransferase
MPRCIYWFGLWEPPLTSWISHSLQPGDTFVDVGANMGYFSLLAADVVGPRGSVVALEPSPQTRQKLDRHIARNQAANVRVVAAAAGSGSGRVPFFRAPWNDAESSTVRRPDLEVETEVRIAPLAELIRPDELRSLRLIKIDVEGAEVDVFAGLEPLFRRAPDAELVIEVHPEALAEQGRSSEDLVDRAEALGLAPYWLPVDFSEEAHLEPPEVSRPVAGRPPGDHLVHLILSGRAGGPEGC